MKTVKQIIIQTPAGGQSANRTSLAVALLLEQRYPDLSAEFLCHFSFATDQGMCSIAAVGSEFRIVSRIEGAVLVVSLFHGSVLERSGSYDLDGDLPFHQQCFHHSAGFFEEVRPYLIHHHGLDPALPLLGGWECATRPELVKEPFIFTIPSISCQVDAAECRFRYFERGDRPPLADQLATFSSIYQPTGTITVLERRDVPERQDYLDALECLIQELSGEAMDKVVLCRKVQLTLEDEISPMDLLHQVAPEPGQNYEFIFRWSSGMTWVGISPETLLKKEGRKITVEPLAGTRKGSDAKSKYLRYRTELLTDCKEHEEHATAAGLFHEQLGTICEPGSITVVESKTVVDLGYVQHLKSKMTGTVAAEVNVFQVLSAVYPPATIWGKPVAGSAEQIRKYEAIVRGHFAGGFGYMTLANDANFALAIRSVKLQGKILDIYAGSGIVKASEPALEWLETSNKMGPFLALAEPCLQHG